MMLKPLKTRGARLDIAGIAKRNCSIPSEYAWAEILLC